MMDERIWALPGPRTLIADAVLELNRHRHVSIVLPERLATDSVVTDALAVALYDEAPRTTAIRRIYSEPGSDSLLEVLSRALVFDDPPATIPELLCHHEVAGSVALVVANELTQSQQAELPNVLRRLERETKSIPGEQRVTFAVIGGRQHLPYFAGGESTDVSLAAVWWWNRIARWDVAAHISAIDHTLRAEGRVLSDVRAETIVEVARWDLNLAETLAREWSGDPEDLRGHFDEAEGQVASALATDRCGAQPGVAVLDLWDRGHIDGWHDLHSESAMNTTAASGRLSRLVWAAQARIILPWIEQHREVVQCRTSLHLGDHRFQAALQDLFDPPLTDASLVEIGPLKRIIEIRLGEADFNLRAAARRLYHARNELAHLRPLKFAELRELVAACANLR